MHTAAILVVLAASSAVNAFDALQQPHMKRAIVQLEARQTGTVQDGQVQTLTNSDLPVLAPSCTSAISVVYGSLPTPPAALVDAFGPDGVPDGGSDACSITVPASLSSDFASYSSQLLGWYSDYSDRVSSVLDECTQLSSLVDMLPICETAVPSHSGGSGSSSTVSSHSASLTDAPAAATTTGDSGDAASGLRKADKMAAVVAVAALVATLF
jgi:hypothetical protein